MSSLNYEVGGNGPRVVLLHPVGLDLTFLSPVASILRQGFKVLTLDQRGHEHRIENLFGMAVRMNENIATA